MTCSHPAETEEDVYPELAPKEGEPVGPTKMLRAWWNQQHLELHRLLEAADERHDRLMVEHYELNRLFMQHANLTDRAINELHEELRVVKSWLRKKHKENQSHEAGEPVV